MLNNQATIILLLLIVGILLGTLVLANKEIILAYLGLEIKTPNVRSEKSIVLKSPDDYVLTEGTKHIIDDVIGQE